MSLLRLALLVPALIFVGPAHAQEQDAPVQQAGHRPRLDRMIRNFARKAELARAKQTILARR